MSDPKVQPATMATGLVDSTSIQIHGQDCASKLSNEEVAGGHHRKMMHEVHVGSAAKDMGTSVGFQPDPIAIVGMGIVSTHQYFESLRLTTV